VSSRHVRSDALIGEATRGDLAAARIVLVGVGGVGSWCAEALLRTGARRLVLVDEDVVAPSNLNRQCPATVAAIGRPKVDALRERLLAIDPEAEIEARCERFSPLSPAGLWGADVVVDAIDSVDCKAELILRATEAGLPLFSSMGAALRLDPTKVTVCRFAKVAGDGLARALRQRFKRLRRWPARPFVCVCSRETPCRSPVRGSVMPVTASFGLVLAAEVINLFRERRKQQEEDHHG
jgi:tRNA A37 threonylcarbamoyladenosine dehydratase